jgi:hypothetical protein
MFSTESTTLFPNVSQLELRFELLEEQFEMADPDSVDAAVIWEQLCDIADAIRGTTYR